MPKVHARLVALLSSFLASTALAEESAKVEDVVTSGVLAALDGDGKTAVKELSRAGLMAPDRPELQDVLALAALTAGDRSRATRLLADRPALALYHAMAVSEGPGGAARARGILATRAKDADAPPSVLFLAALAFESAGDDVRAHELLERAIEKSKSALDPAFAPDPGAAMAERATEVLEKLGAPPEPVLKIAKKLAEKGRRSAASAMADRLERHDRLAATPGAKASARQLRAAVMEKSEPRRALEELESILKEGGEAKGVDLEEVAVKKLELQLVLGELDGARRSIESLGAVKEELRARLHRARARLHLEKGGDAKIALEAAETAASLDPKSTAGLALLARAYVANGELDRALAYANQLVARKPKEVDPFAILASIAEAKHDAGKVRAHRLRSEAFRADKARADAEVKRREAVIRAVRDAERGLGIAGLAAVRAEEPMLGLPIDLATAKSGTPGFKRQARERILSACRGELALFLQRTTGWDHLTLTSSLYGVAEGREVMLSAADPGRCSEAPQRTRAPKNQ